MTSNNPVSEPVLNAQRRAFLQMVAKSEGTLGVGDDGYNVMVGGALFHDYSEHPNQRVFIRRINAFSTAAGRYQILYRFWRVYRDRLNLADFGHDSQDAVAIQQIRECGALADVDAGRFDAAVAKCSRIWASLPGNDYGQRQNPLGELRVAFVTFGGVLAA